MFYFPCAVSQTSGFTTLKICLTFHMKSMKDTRCYFSIYIVVCCAVTVNVCLSVQEQFSVRRVLASCVVFKETTGCEELHFI